MIRRVFDAEAASSVSKSTNKDLDEREFEGLERRKILASRAYQRGIQFVSIDFVLQEIGLHQYIDDFTQASEDMMEAYEFRTDEEVETILRYVEKASGTKLPYRHRCAIWKALRFDWFRSPETAKEFIDRSELPTLLLPKKDFRSRDDKIELKSLDSDRQRMVKRRAIVDEVEGTVVIQDEVYQRMPHLYYELEGLDRTVQYWMSQDPRKMAREDPREEVLLNQVKAMELQVASKIDQLQHARNVKRIVIRFFNVIKTIYGVASVFFLILAIVEAQSSALPAMEAFASHPYLRLFGLYFWTFWFIFEATRQKRKHKSSDYDLARNMHAKCRLLNSDMISFRLKTHFIRQHRVPRFLDDLTVKQEEAEEKPIKIESLDPQGESGVFDNKLMRMAKPSTSGVVTNPPPPSAEASFIKESVTAGVVMPQRSMLEPITETGPTKVAGVIRRVSADVTRNRADSKVSSDISSRDNVEARESEGAIDAFHVAQAEVFENQRRDEELLMDRSIRNVSSDEEADHDMSGRWSSN
jgi:hypothetical protein